MVISVDIPDAVKERLDELKAKTGLSVSVMVRRMVEDHLATGDPLLFSADREPRS